jgi:hypothetical protein
LDGKSFDKRSIMDHITEAVRKIHGHSTAKAA